MFKNREEAGALLADALPQYKDAVVIAIHRGGLPVARAIAQKLSLPLDVLIVKKIGHPDDPELAIGAVAAHSHELNSLARHIPEEHVSKNIARIQKEIHARTKLLRGEREQLNLAGKTAILVDDGIATGATIILATHVVRTQNPKEVVIAIPVAPAETLPQIENVADNVICLNAPLSFLSVGAFYADFREVDDEEVQGMLR
ncbi:MAG TPA: phosphoribosyltransferase family protein [Candidatus Nanoarchaeia archaeon]|nr:phosphoribosyltransferase family protein [Candidatus Nanoarchaeia archaeon]